MSGSPDSRSLFGPHAFASLSLPSLSISASTFLFNRWPHARQFAPSTHTHTLDSVATAQRSRLSFDRYGARLCASKTVCNRFSWYSNRMRSVLHLTVVRATLITNVCILACSALAIYHRQHKRSNNRTKLKEKLIIGR